MSVNFKNKPAVAPTVSADASDGDAVGVKGHRVNMILSAALHTRLREKATQTGLSIPMLLRFAAAEYLSK
ncbi:hypothetical protein [Paraburkholderia megapolitana]|uniref:hypothetical protein n=1 Tax=Paraburkholderia megapolitana TaxID=420953 RepID=UPI0038BD07D3